jgi:hypothetical protein
MTTRDRDRARLLVSDEEFFDSVPPQEQEEEPFDLRPRDPVLERKSTPRVAARRVRFTGIALGVVACAVGLLVAALAHLGSRASAPPASVRTAPESAVHAVASPAPGAASAL